MQFAGNMVSVFFAERPVRDYAGAKATQTWRYPAFFHALLERGVYARRARSRRGSSRSVLDDDAFARIADALPAAAGAAAAATRPRQPRERPNARSSPPTQKDEPVTEPRCAPSCTSCDTAR